MEYQDEVDHWANGDLPNFAPVINEEEFKPSINSIISDIDYAAYAKEHSIILGEKPDNGSFAIYPLADGDFVENPEAADNFALVDENEHVLFVDSSFMNVVDKYNDAYHGIVPEPISLNDFLATNITPSLQAANDSNLVNTQSIDNSEIQQDTLIEGEHLIDSDVEPEATKPVMILVTLADGSVIELEEGFYNQLIAASLEANNADISQYISLPLSDGTINLSPSSFYQLLETSEDNNLKVSACCVKYLEDSKQEYQHDALDDTTLQGSEADKVEPMVAPNNVDATEAATEFVTAMPHTTYSDRPMSAPQSSEKTYEKNVADIGEGARSLVQGAASVVGGGASMVGAAAKAAGNLFKSFGQGINERFTEVEKSAHEPQPDPIDENGTPTPNIQSNDVMAFHKAQLAMREQAFDEQVGKMWQHDQMRPVKEKIKEIASERGVSFESVLQSLPKDEALKELYTEVQSTIENDSELKNSANKAKGHLTGWLDSYKMAFERSQHMEESDDYEADLEIEGAKGRMAEKVEQAPLFDDDGQSSFEAFKQKLEAILEKIKELFQSLGRRSTTDNAAQLDSGM
ncbi:hypothetical protein ACRARQ_003865 [Yersinia enterocolitica]